MAIRELDNGYYVEVFLGTDPVTGKKDRKTKTFKPKNREKLKEAKAWEVKILESYNKGELVLKGNITLNDFLDDWFKTFVKGKKAYNTETRYKVFVDCIKVHLGQVKLDKLRTKMIDEFYDKMSKEMKTLKNRTVQRRYADGTILKTHKMFRLAIQQAVDWEMITKNYVDAAKPPADDKRDIQVVNTRNKGAIASLPFDAAVEVSCVITKEGPRPITQGYLPVAAEGIVQQLKSFERLTCKAAISGKYEDAFIALTTNPLVQSETKARLVLDEMLMAHKAHLPQFSEAIRMVEKNNETNH